MIVCGPAPTRTELVAAARRRAFRQAIAAKAAALKKQKFEAMLETAAAKVRPIQPEAIPAEPDPPKGDCPHCNKSLAVAPDQNPIARAFPSIASIQAVVANFYGITRGDLCSARRMKEVVGPRQIAMYIAKQRTPFSLPNIGFYFGGRDHTTVLHAVRRVEARIKASEQYALEVVSLMLEIP